MASIPEHRADPRAEPRPDAAAELRALRFEASQIRESLKQIEAIATRNKGLTRKVASGVILAMIVWSLLAGAVIILMQSASASS